jgi:dephospho-CoA kinase
MRIVAVTGGLGAGKSTATAYFRSRGASVICLDDLAHYLLEKGTPTHERIVASFGSEVLDSDGGIDREALASKAFSSAEKTRELNSLMHPEIAREVGTSLTELRLMPEHQPESVVLEVPLLAEAPVFAEVADVVLAIAAPVSVRAARAQTRGMSAEDVLRRIERQATDEDRAEFADVVIVNDGDLETFERELAEFWDANVATGGATAR